MAEPWALRHKYWKKRIYLALIESKNLRRASCLHALSRPEIGHLRTLAPWTPICFIPNGVDLAFAEDLPPRSVLEAEHPELRGKFVLLFFGRLHVKKGLDLLAEALGRIAARPSGRASPARRQRWRSLGPVPRPHGAARPGRRMTYLGHVSGERARQVWAAADAFILPSYSEGFSMAVLEALACRLPCHHHHGLPFPRTGRVRGGRRRDSGRGRRHPGAPRPARTESRPASGARPATAASSSRATTPGTVRPTAWPPSTGGSAAEAALPAVVL